MSPEEAFSGVVSQSDALTRNLRIFYCYERENAEIRVHELTLKWTKSGLGRLFLFPVYNKSTALLTASGPVKVSVSKDSK